MCPAALLWSCTPCEMRNRFVYWRPGQIGKSGGRVAAKLTSLGLRNHACETSMGEPCVRPICPKKPEMALRSFVVPRAPFGASLLHGETVVG